MTLGSLVELAADELEAWELSALRDPRNWPRPRSARPPPSWSAPAPPSASWCCAPSAGATSARAQSHGALDLAVRTLRDVGARGAARASTSSH